MLEIKGSNSKQPAYYKQPSGRSKFWRNFRNIVIAVIAISLLIIGAALAYSWYTSQYGGGGKDVVTTIKPTPPLQKPHKAAIDAQIGVATQLLTSPVEPGKNAQMAVHTNADARCTITVTYDKVTSTDSGLMPKIADDYGLAQWSWTVPATAPLGDKSSVDVYCANAKYNAHVLETLVIQIPKPS